jgi:hypothetical protein
MRELFAGSLRCISDKESRNSCSPQGTHHDQICIQLGTYGADARGRLTLDKVNPLVVCRNTVVREHLTEAIRVLLPQTIQENVKLGVGYFGSAAAQQRLTGQAPRMNDSKLGALAVGQRVCEVQDQARGIVLFVIGRVDRSQDGVIRHRGARSIDLDRAGALAQQV